MDEVLLTKDASARRPAICPAGDDGFAVIWTRSDDFRVFGHRLDSVGEPVGDEFPVGPPEAVVNRFPAATGSGATGFAVACATDSFGVSVQFFDPQAVPLTSDRVNPTDAATDSGPAITRLVDGRLVVAWAMTDGGVGARILDPFGGPVGPEIAVASPGTVATAPIRVIGLDSGQFIVIWQAGQDPASGTVLARQRLHASDGQPIGPVLPANLPLHTGELDATAMHAAPWGSGGPGDFVVVHAARPMAGTGSERQMRVVSGGSGLGLDGPDFRLTTTPDRAVARTPAVAALPDGRYVAAWTVTAIPDDGEGTGVRATISTPDTMPPPAFQFGQSATGNQTSPVVAARKATIGFFAGQERVAFAWVHDGESGLTGPVRAIKARVVNPANPLV